MSPETRDPPGGPANRRSPGQRLADLAGYAIAILLTALLLGAMIVQLLARGRDAEAARELNLVAFDEAWSLVREHHFDPDLAGVDWPAVRDELRPRMARTRSRQAGREVLQEMLSRLGQSHLGLIEAEAMNRQTYRGEAGSVGLDLRILDGRAVVVEAAGAGAAAAGIRPGWTLTAVDGTDLGQLIGRLESQQPAGSRHAMQVTEGVRRLLFGPLGASKRLVLVDGDGEPRQATIELAPPPGRLAQVGEIPASYVSFTAARRLSDILHISLDAFTYPAYVLRELDEALAGALDARGLVIDLRGNGGGILEMVTAMLGWLVTEKSSIGTMVFRDGEVPVTVQPRARSYAGPVAVLIDELCLSGSELFAHGIRQLDRGVLVGSATSGSVLGGRLETLATGDALMFVVSDFRTLDGQQLEGVGVAPDIEVRPSRGELLAGQDPVLAAATDWILSQPPPAGPGLAPRRAPPVSAALAAPPQVEARAAEVLDGYVAATGGAAAYASLESRVSHGLLVIGSEEGIPLRVTVRQARGGRSHTMVESDYLGDTRIGTTGERAWRSDLLHGDRWLEADEHASLLRRFRLDGPAQWRRELRRADHLGLEEIAGRRHHHLRLEPNLGAAEEHWYDEESGLLTRVVARSAGPLAGARGSTELSDYRWADGVLLPYRASTSVLGIEQLLTFDSIEHDVELPDDLFRPPAELIAALD